MQTVEASVIIHDNAERIQLRFENCGPLNKLIQSIKGARWSRTLKSWHIPRDVKLYTMFKSGLPQGCLLKETKATQKQNNGSAEIETPKPFQHITKEAKQQNTNAFIPTRLSAANQQEYKLYTQHLILKAYSPSTIKTYTNEFGAFLQTLGNTSAKSLTTQRVKDYLQYCFVKLKLSENTIHSRMNALKFYYEQVLNREQFFWDIPRPKKPLTLPKLLNETEIKKVFNALANKKHKAMLFTAYSAGLRVSEIVNLKLSDIDSRRMQIFIEKAKGKKDRYVNLSPVLLDILRSYLKHYLPQPKVFLFESDQTLSAYSIRTVQQIFFNAKHKAGFPCAHNR